MVFFVENRKSDHCHWILYTPISLTNFSLNRSFWFFWDQTPQNSGYSNLQKYIPNFSLNQQFWFSGPNLPKKSFSSQNTENVHHHRMLHTYISLGTKFQLKLIILFFWTKFAQKGYFQKHRKKEQHHWILHIQISLHN